MHCARMSPLLLAAGVVHAGEIVLFDAAATPISALVSQSGGSFAARGEVLEVATRGNTGYPGVLVKGSWDLSACNRITFELVNLDSKGELPLTIRLDDPDADPGRSRGVFVDRVKLAGHAPQACTVALPPTLPNARAIQSRLTGMRAGPLTTTGVVADLDASRVVGVAVYLRLPKLDWRWGIRRIVATIGEAAPVPDWMRLPEERFFPFIDVYGQFRHKEWPGKIHSDADLRAARERERADLDAHPGPKGWGRFGGWAEGPKQAATRHFRVQKIDDTWWLVDPDGYLYWSHGPVRVTPSFAMTPLDGRETFFTDLPAEDSPFAEFYRTRDELLHPYYVKRNIRRTYDFSAANCRRKYGEEWFRAFADQAHLRLRSWGLNTIANGSDRRICLMDRTPYADRFELKSRPIAGSHDGWWPFRDPFDAGFRAEVRRHLEEHRREMEDPWCFGFFVDNELSWGGPTDLAAWTLASPPDQPAKIEFRDRLRARYAGVEALNAAWATEYPDWDGFLADTRRPGPGADEDLQAFSLTIAEAYFRNIREEFKAAAPGKLYLGCRFAGRGPEFAVRVAAAHCDVVSYNIYARHLDDFRLPAGIDKPVLIGEFHFGALDRGLFHPGLIKLADQEERGRTYVRYVTSALNHPQVVGVHWHQFGDQATTGRFDGENFQVGFVDCCDSPYPETVAGIREVGYHLYEIRAARRHTGRP
ncbi:MAG: beta-agarase [Lentisphaeria bacterium]|nr:beta-agarase [Lentisphaeria bacterium]